MSTEHLHSCPRCLGVESCTSPACLMRADLSDIEHFGDPRRCALCRKAGRALAAAEAEAERAWNEFNIVCGKSAV